MKKECFDMNQQATNKRIAKNTFALYIRMFVTMAVSLYTSRVLLQVLGVSDFGLYNVVGGIVSSFAMLSAALTVGTQRFLTYTMGEGDKEKLKRVFSTALGLHIFFAFVLLIFAETVGLWFVYQYLNVPEGRFTAAVWIYQFSVFAFLINLVQVPFQSCIISNERMNIYAYMSIYDAGMKLLMVFVIQILSADKLILYGAMVFIVQMTTAFFYNSYCRRHFAECSFHIRTDLMLAKQMLAYTGWNIFGGSIGFVTGQGLNILLNIFYGTVVNAASGLAMSINSMITQFVTNFQMAVNPQIVKQYAAKEFGSLYRLVVNNARIAQYLYLFIAIPAFIEIDFVLQVWLGEVPAYTAIFVRIILIQSALSPVDYPVGMLIHANGKLKWPMLVTVVPMYSIIVVSYYLLKGGASPVCVYVVSAIGFIWKNICDLAFAHKYAGISVKTVLNKVYLNVLIGTGIMFVVPYWVSLQMPMGWIRFLLVGMVSVFWSGVVIYSIGLTKGMRSMLIDKIVKFSCK